MISKGLMLIMALPVVAQMYAGDEQVELHDRLRCMIRAKAPLETITMLVERITDVDVQYGALHRTLCHFAAVWDNEYVIAILFNKGANVNAKDVNGETPLHDACRSDAPSAGQALLVCGASLEVKNKWGMTPLDIARTHGNQDIVKCIEDFENIPDVKEPEGN